jgi:hypothetical protein
MVIRSGGEASVTADGRRRMAAGGYAVLTDRPARRLVSHDPATR